MNWKDRFSGRLLSADEAVRQIRSGETISIAHVGSEPYALVDALARNADALTDVDMHFMLSLRKEEPHIAKGMEKHLRFFGYFLGGSTRGAVAESRAEYLPCFFHLYPRMLRERGGVDVLLISVSEPDAHGYCSMGPGIDHLPAFRDSAKLVIAQMNRNLPRVMGDSFIHLRDIDIIVEEDRPMPTLAPPTITEVEQKIGEYCASLVQDGDTIQLGIGGIPEFGESGESFQEAIFRWVDSGRTVVMTTQVPEEGLDLGVYEVGRAYADYPGILRGDDMTTETLVAKTMWALGQSRDAAEIQRLFYSQVNRNNACDTEEC